MTERHFDEKFRSNNIFPLSVQPPVRHISSIMISLIGSFRISHNIRCQRLSINTIWPTKPLVTYCKCHCDFGIQRKIKNHSFALVWMVSRWRCSRMSWRCSSWGCCRCRRSPARRRCRGLCRRYSPPPPYPAKSTPFN